MDFADGAFFTLIFIIVGVFYLLRTYFKGGK